MKNPFKFFKSKQDIAQDLPAEPSPVPTEEEPTLHETEPEAKEPAEADDFTEWCRTRVQGGIERRERNDIYEAYSVYGADSAGQLICRLYHRYPEHEKDFGLSYSRTPGFSDFNKRLFAELDRGSLSLTEYNACIARAEQLLSLSPADKPVFEGFTGEQTEALRGFCESMDNLKDKEYRTAEGIFRCSCSSIVGDEALILWFRQPLPHDAAQNEVAGVEQTEIAGYDIDDLWIMGVYNRLRELCESCRVTRLRSKWSLNGETVTLMTAEGFPGIDGTLMLAVSDPASMARFGFYALDFSRK